MKTVDWRTFNYWDPEHFEIHKVTGSKEECLYAYEKEKSKYPVMQYATTIADKNFEDAEGESYIVIKRFKTKELMRIHHDYPVTYVREGKVL